MIEWWYCCVSQKRSEKTQWNQELMGVRKNSMESRAYKNLNEINGIDELLVKSMGWRKLNEINGLQNIVVDQ